MGKSNCRQQIALNNISQIYDARGDYDTALNYLEKSLIIRQEIGDIAGEAVTAFNMAHIHERNGNLTKALALAQRTVFIDLQTRHPDLLSDAGYLIHLIEDAHKNGHDIQKLVDPQVMALLSQLAEKMDG